jgi:hypothetical protein
MTEGSPGKKTVWKDVFVGKNPDTGRKYFKRVKVTAPKSTKNKDSSSKTKMRTPRVEKNRGNYNADIVGDAMDKRDEEKERNVRVAKGLPPEE